MPHPSTDALVAEIRTPSVTNRAAFATALKTLVPALAQVGEQAAVLQRLLGIAEDDETDEAVAQSGVRTHGPGVVPRGVEPHPAMK